MGIRPCEDFAVRFRNKTDTKRTDEEIQAFVSELKNLGIKYNFGSPSFDSWEPMRKAAIGEQMLIDAP